LKLFEKSGFLPVQKGENYLTWNAAAPTVEIDHVYYRPSQNIAIKPVSITVLNEPEASDHRPVVAKIKITKK
jgi:endonuclease/exonuclease/phosphatase family metal-dependent hydrolase